MKWMGNMGTKDVHFCSLKEERKFPTLPPNAKFCQKVAFYVREMIILDCDNAEGKRLFKNRSFMDAERKRHICGPHFYIIHPYSKFSFYWQCFMIIIFSYLANVQLFPYAFVFYDRNKAGVIMDKISFHVSIFAKLNILISFLTGYSSGMKVELSPHLIAIQYLKTYLIVDIISLFEWWAIAAYFWPDLPRSTIHQISWISWFILVRLLSVKKYMRNITFQYHIKEELTFFAETFFMTLTFVHTSACFMYNFHKYQYLTDNFVHNSSWFKMAGIDAESNKTLLDRYSVCLAMGLNIVLAIGQVDYKITDNLEQAVIMSLEIGGNFFVLTVVAQVIQLFDFVNLCQIQYEELRSQFKDFFFVKRLPPFLAKRINRYLNYKYHENYFKEAEILKQVSEILQQEIFLHGARQLIQKCGIFAVIPKLLIGELISTFRQEVYLPNDVLAEIGDDVDYVYLIAFGTVYCLNDENKKMLILEDGDDIGAVELFQKQRTFMYTYECAEFCEIFLMDIKLFVKLLESPSLLSYFDAKERTRKALEKRIERHRSEKDMTDVMDMDDIVEELRKGRILEKRRERQKNIDTTTF